MKLYRLNTFNRTIFITFIICLFSNISFADSSQGILKVNEVYKDSASLTPKVYPNSDCILVNNYILEKYNADGTATVWDDTFIKVLTEKGKRENSILSFYYTLPYSTVKLTQLSIIRADGTVKNINIAKQSNVMINNSQMNSNIYNPNSKILKVNIPDLQVGDIIRYVSFRDQVKARMPNAWSDYNIFEVPYPINKLTLEIISPKKLPLRKINIIDKIKNTVNYTSTNNKETTIHKWEVKDVPRMFPEPNMPPLSSVVQRLLVSTVSSWEDISKWYWNLCLPHLDATTEEMQNKVDELIKDKKTDLEKVKAIFYFVSQKIRYMGITTEKEAPGFEPHNVNITFENKYGVCRDKAALLVAMLRLAGFQAYPVIIKVGPKMDKEVPMINFNHAISCVELSPEKYTLMDPTNETTKELLPSYLCNKSYLVAKPNGSTLQTTPIIPAEKNLMDITTNGKLSETGKFTAEVLLKFNGINDNIYRGFFANNTPEENQRFFEKVIRKVLPSSELIDLNITPKNMLDTSESVRVKIIYEAENLLIGQNKTALLQLPWFGKTVGIINYVIREAGLKKRKYPLNTETTCGYKEKLNINYSDKYFKFDVLPTYKNIDTETITYKQKLENSSKKFEGSSEMMLKAVELLPKQYLAFKKTIKELEINRKKMPVISIRRPKVLKNTNKNDIEILEKNTEINLKNENSWHQTYSTKFKVLSYSGKKKYSEIKIPYNPALETVELEYAFVTDKNGKRLAITKDEINRMDAGWVGSAPRYPPEKILVINLPGVEIGSLIEFKLKIEAKDLPFFSEIHTFREENSIVKSTLKLTVPKDIKPNILKANFKDIKESISKTESQVTYEWTAKNQQALKKEIMLPPSWTFLPTVLISTGNWKNYCSELEKKFKKSASTTDYIKQLTQKIIANTKDTKDKLIAIRDYIAKNILLRGPSFTELPITSITDAETTLKDGYGNSADRAIVFFSILNAAGFEPGFVLVSDFYSELDSIISPIFKTPQQNFFNEVLVAVNLKEEGTVYLNDTNEYSALGSTPNEFNGGIDLKTHRFITIKPIKGKEDKIISEYQISLNDNASCIFNITKLYYGNAFGVFNKKFEELRPEERDRYFQTLVSSVSQAAKPLTDLETDFSSYPGSEKFTLQVDNFSTISDIFYYFRTPVMFRNIFNLGKEKRFYPYYQPELMNSIYNINITFPSEYKDLVISPTLYNISLPNKSGNLQQKIMYESSEQSTDRKGVSCLDKIKVNIKPTILSAEQYDELIDINQKVTSPSSNTIMLKKM